MRLPSPPRGVNEVPDYLPRLASEAEKAISDAQEAARQLREAVAAIEASVPLTDGAALSVLGRSANSAGPRADIAAGTNHQVLRRSGTALDFGAVNLAQSAAVTGALPIANGGTGQTGANAGFNALAPTTTRGDIIRRGEGGNVRLALGTAGQVLTSDGTDVVWGVGGVAGNWTPAIQGLTTAGAYTYSSQSGRFSLIGQELHLDFQVVVNTVTTAGAGTILITGIPITMPNNGIATGSVLLAAVAGVPAGFSSWILSRRNSSTLQLLLTNTSGNSPGAPIETVVRAGTFIRGSIDMVQP